MKEYILDQQLLGFLAKMATRKKTVVDVLVWHMSPCHIVMVVLESYLNIAYAMLKNIKYKEKPYSGEVPTIYKLFLLWGEMRDGFFFDLLSLSP